MAISDVKEYTHLTEEDVEQLGRELDAIRAEIEESRGASDAAYINRMIRIQRGLAVAGRLTLMLGTQAKTTRKPGSGRSAATFLGLHKILENMEIGHNVMHGQWDWMNDPEIHSSNWEWDTAQPAEQWKHCHNYVHHQFTNVLGYDNDIGYGILRMAREQKWSPVQPRAARLQRAARRALPVGRRPARPRHRGDPQGQEGPQGDEAPAQADLAQGPQPGAEGLRRLPRARRSAVEDDDHRQRRGQLHPQRLVLRDHLLRPLPRRRDALHRGGDRGRDPGRVVPAPDPRRRELRGRPAAAHHVRQPRLPDRAPPVPGPAEQPVRRDLGQGAGALRRSTTSPTRPGRCTSSTARRCARS